MQFIQNQTPFSRDLALLFNFFPLPTYVLAITKVLQSCKPVSYLNLILFPNFHLIQLPNIKSVHIKHQCCFLLTASITPNFQPPDIDQYRSHFPSKIVHEVYSNTISYLSICDQPGFQSSHKERSRCIYECFVVGTSCTSQSDFFISQIYNSNSIIISIPMQTLIPNSRFENILSSLFYIKISHEYFFFCIQENNRKPAVIPHKNCLLNHHFSPYIVHTYLKQ